MLWRVCLGLGKIYTWNWRKFKTKFLCDYIADVFSTSALPPVYPPVIDLWGKKLQCRMMSLVVMSQMFSQERFLLGKFHSGKAIISSNIKLIRMRKQLFQPWNMFDVGRLFLPLFFAAQSIFHSFHSYWYLVKWRLKNCHDCCACFLRKTIRNRLSFFWISQKPCEENPFQFETTFVFGGLYQRPPHRYMALSNQQEPRSHPHPIHQEVMFHQPLLRSPLRATTLMVPTHRAVTGFTTRLFIPEIMWVKSKGKTRYKNGLKYHLGEGCLLWVEDVCGICVVNMRMYLIIFI